ncbi:porin family protein [Desertivirga brevis]|uniref:porin family protein n=1 Tax=Desertivirga brevis TaxID=2810310 RepID=UPI001A97C575|nr:porin family protein [Pedobacter sp. SYSU D00873]
MKKLFFTAMMLVAGSSLFAQTKFGLKAGVNFANQEWSAEGMSLSPTSNTSFHFFGFADLGVSERISIQPGLGISGKGFKVKGDEGGTANAMYLEIPVNAVAKFPTGSFGHLFLGAGPYAAVGIAGKAKADGEEADFFGDDSGYKRGDFGLNFLGGIELNNGLLFNVNYGLGLADIAKSEEDLEGLKIKNRVFSISVGFAF